MGGGGGTGGGAPPSAAAWPTAIATPLVFLAILFGVAPQLLFNYVTPTVNRQVETLANWTREVRPDWPATQTVETAAEPAARVLAGE